jgi:hypothetical protein
MQTVEGKAGGQTNFGDSLEECSPKGCIFVFKEINQGPTHKVHRRVRGRVNLSERRVTQAPEARQVSSPAPRLQSPRAAFAGTKRVGGVHAGGY